MKLNNILHRLGWLCHCISPLFIVVALLALTGCDKTQYTPEQIAAFEAYQKEQAEAFATKVEAVTTTAKGVADVAAPVAAIVPGGQTAAAAIPLASNLIEILGGSALALFGVWQRLQALRYKRSGEAMIAAIDRLPPDAITVETVKKTVADTARQDGTGDHLEKWVQANSYRST